MALDYIAPAFHAVQKNWNQALSLFISDSFNFEPLVKLASFSFQM